MHIWSTPRAYLGHIFGKKHISDTPQAEPPGAHLRFYLAISRYGKYSSWVLIFSPDTCLGGYWACTWWVRRKEEEEPREKPRETKAKGCRGSGCWEGGRMAGGEVGWLRELVALTMSALSRPLLARNTLPRSGRLQRDKVLVLARELGRKECIKWSGKYSNGKKPKVRRPRGWWRGLI
jgi:hypothetical protein